MPGEVQVPAVPRWAWLPALGAPVLLIGGWTLAASQQPGIDPLVDTISDLAAIGANDRWIMTFALAGLGLCHCATALALRPAALPGRLVLAAGGVATSLVAAFPLPADRAAAGDAAGPHGAVAGTAFLALALWPALSWRRGGDVPRGLRPAYALPAAVLLAGLVGWFAVEFGGEGGVGLAERAAAGAQSLWPLAVVATARLPGWRAVGP